MGAAGRRRAAIARAGQRWPGLARLIGLHRYPRPWLRGDLLAGVTVAACLVPQVMAYAQVAACVRWWGCGRRCPRWSSSSASRTAIGTTAGSRTQLYSVTAAVMVAVVVLLRPLLTAFPEAALAAIVIYAATRLIDVQAVEALRDELARDGAVFALARVKQDLLVRLKAFGLAAKIGQDRLFPTLPTAVAAYHQQWATDHEHHPGEEPGESRESA